MLNLLNQLKHDESKPRLALQIRNQEHKRSRKGVDEEQNEVFRIPVRKFAPRCKNSHQGAKLMPCGMFSLPFLLTF